MKIREAARRTTYVLKRKHEDEEVDTGIRPKKIQDKKKPTGVLKNVMHEDQRGCKKNNVRAEEEQITAVRTKQHEDGEEDTGIRRRGGKK